MKNSKTRSSSVSNNRFAQIPTPNLQRSLFKRNFGNKFTLNEGDIHVIHCDEIYAGDTLNANLQSFIRMTTPIAPVMDSVEFDLHAFFVPSRLVMEDYYKMLGEQVDPDSSTDVLIPQITTTTFLQDSIADQFGLPTKVLIPQDDMPIALPFRAYNLIWNDWYRDQNLQDSLEVKTDLTNDSISLYEIQKRNKKHDYFTSCLPNAQRGDAVNIDLGGIAPIYGDGYALTFTDGTNYGAMASNTTATPLLSTAGYDASIGDSYSAGSYGGQKFVGLPTLASGENSHAYADLSSSSGMTINDLRDALSIQHILERRQRGGTRDVEILSNMYGVSPSDSRLQRPELIGTSRGDLVMNTVAQTSSTDTTSPLGELSAIGTINSSMNFTYSAVENGFLLILASARAEVSYQQGMAKMWSKRSYLDILDPLRANIGEQPVLRKEIYTSTDTEDNNTVFGYLPNYDDLRFGRNIITGAFRSNHDHSLDIWHYAEEFETAPVLGAEFIQQQSPVDRTLAVPENNPDFFGDMYMKINHYRVLPTYGLPGLTRI
jgi:hypothetical protein